jgi:hypothetical protein
LTPSAVSNAKPQAKPYKLADERGMFLLVQPSGAKWWRFKYRRPGTHKENLLSLGTFPDVSLRRAREKRDDARRLLADGIDPGEKRKSETLAGAETFEAVAREWFGKFSPKWAKGHADKIIRRLERDVFPWLGSKPIATISSPDLLGVLRRIEARGAVETAHCSPKLRAGIPVCHRDRARERRPLACPARLADALEARALRQHH